MAQLFPRWSNGLPRLLAIGAGLAGAAGGLTIWLFFSPSHTDVGYSPEQPVPFSHAQHVGELRVDCRYCHVGVERAAVASIPSTRTCMNCHNLVARDKESLEPLRESHELAVPIAWVRVHKVPEYAFFDHGIHMRAGVPCRSCHGDVSEMERVVQVEPLSMGWCLDCHRDAARQTVPLHLVTGMGWQPPRRVAAALASSGAASGSVNTDCSACHR